MRYINSFPNKFKILSRFTIDQPSEYTHVIYDRKSVDYMVAEWKRYIKDRILLVIPSLEVGENAFNITELDIMSGKMCGLVTDVEIINDKVQFEIQFIPTQTGYAYNALLDSGSSTADYEIGSAIVAKTITNSNGTISIDNSEDIIVKNVVMICKTEKAIKDEDGGLKHVDVEEYIQHNGLEADKELDWILKQINDIKEIYDESNV